MDPLYSAQVFVIDPFKQQGEETRIVWASKALLLSILAVLSVSVSGCQQDPLIGKWECIVYKGGNTTATGFNEMLEFTQEGRDTLLGAWGASALPGS